MSQATTLWISSPEAKDRYKRLLDRTGLKSSVFIERLLALGEEHVSELCAVPSDDGNGHPASSLPTDREPGQPTDGGDGA